MLTPSQLLKKIMRFGKASLLSPRRIAQTCERLQCLEEHVGGRLQRLEEHIGGRLQCLEVDVGRLRESLPPVKNEADLQKFSGYSAEDLEILHRFRAYDVRGEPGFIKDFLGTRIRTTSVPTASRHLDGKALGLPVSGQFFQDVPEWVGLLKSVHSAQGSFRAMELGAGWAPWLVAGAVAARSRGIRQINLCGVEADPNRFAMMEEHFRDNDLDPNEHTLLLAAVGATPGKARWPRGYNPTDDLGTRPMVESDRLGETAPGDWTDYRGLRFNEFIDVDIVGFANLLERQSRWDLVHIDIQGWEREICPAAVGLLNQRVRWLIIGTHSRKIEGDLIELFYRNGWLLENEKPTRFNYQSSLSALEGMTTIDGVQVWRNPRLGG